MAGVGIVNFISISKLNPNLIFTGSPDGGLFYSEDNCESWQSGGTDRLGPFNGVAHCISDVTNDNTWFMATGDGEGDKQFNKNSQNPSSGVYRSNDKGQHWIQIGNFHDPNETYPTGCVYLIKKLLMHPTNNNILYAVGTHGLYVTLNAQAAQPIWTQIMAGNNYEPFYDIEFLLNTDGTENPNQIVVSGERVLLTINQGTSWTDLNLNPSGNIRRIALETSPNASKLIYASVSTDLGSSFWIYDYSDTQPPQWYFKSNITIDISRQQSIGVSPIDKNLVYIGDVGGSFTSNALSTSVQWNSFYNQVHDDVHQVKFSADGNKIYLAGDGGVFVKDLNVIAPAIPTWVAKNNGLVVANTVSVSVSKQNHNNMSAGIFHCGGNIKTDGVWKHVSPGDGFKTIINPDNENIIYTSSQGGSIYKNTNSGNNVSSGIGAGSSTNFFTTFELNPSESSTVHFNNKNFGMENLFRKKNHGVNAAENLTDFNTNLSNLNVSSGNEANVYATAPSNGNRTYLFVLDPNRPSPLKQHRLFYNSMMLNADPVIIQANWNEINLPTSAGRIKNISVSPSDENLIFLIFENYTLPYWAMDNQIYSYNLTTNTWVDLKKNFISCLIPTSIAYQDGDNPVLYIGTDKGGVWSLANPLSANSNWTVFNNNIPLCSISELVIDECTNKLIAATFGRGIWQANLLNSNNNWEITTQTTISNPVEFNKNIIIKNGGSLIVNEKASMSVNKTIVVERGAQLIIDGPNAKITNACQARWPGIQVWGNSNVPQNSANAAEFGKVILRNGGTIENAETGIITMKIDEQGNWDWNYSGGIVQCTNANFINNGRDVSFLNYANLNANGQEMITQSYFTKTNFITNDSYNYKEFAAPQWHVTIDHSTGIRFKGCNFKNLYTQSPEGYKGIENLWAGGGIYAINSQVNVDQYCPVTSINCTNGTPTRFENLREGISVTGTLKNRKLNCLNSEFVNNATNGISVRSQNYASIISNDFIYNNSNNYLYAAQSGLYQIGALIVLSTGYRVEENNFNGNSNGTLSQAGIKIVNSGGAPNEIYRNTFTNLYYGATALGTNKNTKILANGVGLQLLCLTHQNNRWDNSVTKKFNEPGIALYQGNLLGPNFRTADNTFSNITGTACTDVFNYYNECEFINYAGSSNLQYSPTLYDCNSIYVSNNIATNTGCPTKIGWHKKLSTAERQSASNNLHAKSVELQNAKNVLSLVTDGGNTSSVISAIAQSQPTQTQQLVSDLMSLSPNVSIPVLLKVAHEDDKMSPTLQMLVLIANTQGGKNRRIIDTLRNKQNPMDPAMIDYILDNRNNTSLKEKIESQVNTLIAEKDYFALVLLNDLMEDTIGVDKDSIAMLIDQMEGNEKYYAKIFAAVNDNNFMLCDSLYNNWGDSIEGKYELADYESISEIIALEKTLIASNRNYHQLDMNEIESLRNLASGDYATMGIIMAQNILENAVGDVFEPYLKFPEEVQERRSKPQQEKIANPAAIENAFFKLYPNPTKSQTNLSYLLLPSQKGVATISDSNGKVVYETVLSNDQNSLSIDLSNLAPSTYFLNVMVDSLLKYNETLVIRR